MVIKFKKYIKIIFLCNVLTLSAIIYGCSPTNILASGGGTALVVAEGERSLGAVVDDTTIKVNIAAKFINAIEIGNRSGLKDYASDLWINTQARGVAAKTVGLRSVGYNFETIQGKLYVAGITSNPEQLGSLIEALKTIKGVKEIVNYVIVVEASS